MPDALKIFELELPEGTDAATLAAIEQEVKATEGVKRAGSDGTRSVDLQALTMWVSLAASVVTTAGATITVVQQVLGIFRKHKIKGVKLKLPNGAVLEADEMTVDELKQVVDG